MVLADRESPLPLEYPLEEPSWVPETREGIVAPILPDADGMLQPFTRPGLGFEIDRGLLRRYGKRFFKITEGRLKLKVVREKGLRSAMEIKRRKDSAASL